MNNTKTANLSSALKGLIPAQTGTLAGIQKDNVVLKVPQLSGEEGLRSFIRQLIKVDNFKANRQTDRLYVYTVQQVTDNLIKQIGKFASVRKSGPYSFVVEKMSTFATTATESFETFSIRVKRLATTVCPTGASVTFKADATNSRIYVYMKSVNQRLVGFETARDKLVKELNSKVTSIGQYGLSLRIDYVPVAATTAAGEADIVFESNKLLAGLQAVPTGNLLTNPDAMFEHIELLRGKVSNDVLEKMKQTLRDSLPKAKWKVTGLPIEVINKLGTVVDLDVYYALASKPGNEQVPQHVGDGLKVRLNPQGTQLQGLSLTLFLARDEQNAMYAVLRDAKGYHNHCKLVRK